MDECFQESLVYSESDGSEVDEPTGPNSIEPTTQLSKQNSSPIDHSNEIPNFNGNDSSDGSDNEDLTRSIRKTKKNARILSSDDEKENSNNESHVEENCKQISDIEPMEIQTNISVRPSICDSDTKSSDNGNKSDEKIQPPKNIKKIKKKKNEMRKRLLAVDNASDSDSNDENKEKPDKKKKKSIKRKNASDKSDDSNSSKSGTGSESGSGSGSSSDSNSSTHSNNQTNAEKILKPREKTAQRMSAKMAEQQLKEIQSESQRLARQLHVSIPYHKPKQHSLKEFLSRRSIVEQQEKLNSKPIPKAAVAIKMSGDELIQFMEHMNKRTKEAEEFFQDGEEEEDGEQLAHKSDDSEDEDWTDKAKVETEEPTESSKEIVDANNVHQQEMPMEVENSESVTENRIEDTNEFMDQSNDNNQMMETIVSNATTSEEPTNIITFHTERTELDDELDRMLRKENRLKLDIPIDQVPKLKGDNRYVIDFDTNDIKLVPKSGVEELFSRFMKSACKKAPAAEQQDVGIFHSDTATIERHKFNVNLDDKPKREPKPGESLFRLRSELSQKIRQNREKLIAQRMKEKKEQKQLDSEEGEEEDEEKELCDEEDDPDLCEAEKEFEEPNEVDQLIDSEAVQDEEQSEQNDDSDPNEGNSEDEDEDEDNEQSDAEPTVDLDVTEIAKSRKRILIADDSDDEQTEPSPINAVPTENGQTDAVPQSELKSADQSFDEPSKAMTSHDLSALESEILQLDSQTNNELNKSETSKLFQGGNNDYGEISESQLMDLCSGAFVTQYPENPTSTEAQSVQCEIETNKHLATQIEEKKEVTQNKPAFLSSDEEEIEKNTTSKKLKKKRKKQTLVYSDDEDEPEEAEEQDEEVDEEQIEDEEEDIGERYIEYDSDENEIEVQLKKIDVKKKASEYVENEAELSESEWGSADEDEKDEMNQYEVELGDLEKFDKNRLKDELERIRLREQIDDDAREIRILTERFIEEEDNGMERERKFRWKHLNNGENDDQVQNVDQNDAAAEQNNSDDENEAEWRRIRYEREQLLKQKVKENEAVVERTTVESVTEQKTAENVSTIFNNTRRLSIIKPINNVSSKPSSPFLITRGDLNMSHLSRKSFLNRDSPILEKLASLSKMGTDGEAIMNTAKGKGNYVFVATEKKDNSKRKSESGNGAMEPGATNPSKKSKLDIPKNTVLRPQTKAFFESLN